MDNIKNSPIPANDVPAAVVTLSEPNDINGISPWEIDFRQIEAGPMISTLTARMGANITLLEVSLSRTVHQTGSSPVGMVSVGLIQPKRVETWQGVDTISANLLSFGCADPFDGVSATDFVGATLSIKEEYIEYLADCMGLDIPDNLRTSGIPEISGSRRHLSNLHSISARLLASKNGALAARDEEAIVGSLLLATNKNMHCDQPSPPKARVYALNRALEMIVAHERECIPISLICQEAGVSWRTLDRAFKDKFGIGPKGYQNRLRLNRVRTKLLKEPKETKIADIANEWGYWHLGQFARDYRTMFGELPSSTLQHPRWVN